MTGPGARQEVRTAKLGDLGLARRLDHARLAEGAIVGSVAYLAPEQALGEPVDARTDLYAIGVTLYELVTARLPFVGDDPVSVIHLVRTPAPRCAGVPGKDPRDFLPARCVLAAGPFRILTEREEAASVLKAV